jgi:hypothetical protein
LLRKKSRRLWSWLIFNVRLGRWIEGSAEYICGLAEDVIGAESIHPLVCLLPDEAECRTTARLEQDTIAETAEIWPLVCPSQVFGGIR